MDRTPSRMIWPKMSIVLRLRSPALIQADLVHCYFYCYSAHYYIKYFPPCLLLVSPLLEYDPLGNTGLGCLIHLCTLGAWHTQVLCKYVKIKQ